MEVQKFFVDEAGTPTIFHESGKIIVDSPGCSRFFIPGKLAVAQPESLSTQMTALRQEMLGDPMFAGAESFKPERKRTAVAFHAKDDLPEVRFRVFDLLRRCGDQLRFYAVVCDKLQLHDAEAAKRVVQPGYRFNENSVYDSLMRELFGKFHHTADRYEVWVAKRGNTTRNEAIRAALVRAESDFEAKFGFRRSEPATWPIKVQASKDQACLQAVDYFLWALQRFYEVKRSSTTKKQLVDSKSGLPIREDRFLNALWPQVGEIHDLHFGPAHGTFFTAQNALRREDRFPPPGGETKKP